MRSAIIKKASTDEQQNQTKTNTNYIQNLMSNFLNNNKVKIASDKTEQNNSYFTRKDIGPGRDKAR